MFIKYLKVYVNRVVVGYMGVEFRVFKVKRLNEMSKEVK